MKKGFTLVELLAIIILLAGVFMLTYPKLTELFQREEEKIDELTLDTFYNAADDYLDDKNYETKVGNEYCIKLEELDNENYIPFDTKEYTDKAVRVKIGKSSNYHELVAVDMVEGNNQCKSKATSDQR